MRMNSPKPMTNKTQAIRQSQLNIKHGNNFGQSTNKF